MGRMAYTGNGLGCGSSIGRMAYTAGYWLGLNELVYHIYF
jgi:hypothetical protein